MRTKGEIQVICFFSFKDWKHWPGRDRKKKNLNPLSLTSYKKEIGDQRFVSSIGNIEKAMRVFNCLATGLFWDVLKISAILLKYPTFEGVFFSCFITIIIYAPLLYLIQTFEVTMGEAGQIDTNISLKYKKITTST